MRIDLLGNDYAVLWRNFPRWKVGQMKQQQQQQLATGSRPPTRLMYYLLCVCVCVLSLAGIGIQKMIIKSTCRLSTN